MQREEWHLDKKVPIAIIGAIVGQTLFFVYVGTAWKTNIEGRVVALERTDAGQATHETRITVLEQGVLRIREDLAEIKALIREATSAAAQSGDPSSTRPNQKSSP